MAPAGAVAGVKAGGCSVLTKVVIATVSIAVAVVVISVAVPLALRNNGVQQLTATVNTTTVQPNTATTPGGETGDTLSTDSGTRGMTTSAGIDSNTTFTQLSGDSSTVTTGTNSGQTTVSSGGSSSAGTRSNDSTVITAQGGNPVTTSASVETTIGGNPNTESGSSNTTPVSGTTGDNFSDSFTGTSAQNNIETTADDKTSEADTPITTAMTTLAATTPAFECDIGYNRTIILMKANVTTGDYLFLRGGLSYTLVPGGCRANPVRCKVAIKHRTFVSSGGFIAYNTWARGDNYLDFDGLETNQSNYAGAAKQSAEGSPAVLSSSDTTKDNYLSYNTFGDDYWAMDVCMECPDAQDGWFEVLGYTDSTKLETQVYTISQGSTCDGTAPEAGMARNFASIYHVAMCGRLNVFEFGESNCTINNLSV